MIDPKNSVTLRYQDTELTTNDPFLISAKTKLAQGVAILALTSFTMGGLIWSQFSAWLVVPLILLSAFNGWMISRILFGIWLKSLTHILDIVKHSSTTKSHAD